MEKTVHSEEYARFLQVLRAAREQSGLTQEDVALKLDTTQSFVSKCERGERRLDVVELRAWCSALGINMQDFIAEFASACREPRQQ